MCGCSACRPTHHDNVARVSYHIIPWNVAHFLDRYDGYVSGLRGITAPGDADAVESNKMTAPATTATDSAQGQRLGAALLRAAKAKVEGCCRTSGTACLR